MIQKIIDRKLVAAFLLVGLMIMMGVNLASAAEWDNSLSPISLEKGEAYNFDGKQIDYNSIWDKYAPIKIENAFGLGSTLFEGYIDKHTSSCFGSCESEIVIKLYERGSLIDDVRFKKLLNGEWKDIDNINYKIYLKNGEEENRINDYTTLCEETGEIAKNGSKIISCSEKSSGSHIEIIPLWKEYNLKEELDAGVYTVKISGNKKMIDTIDWQIETKGEWIESWATWNSAYALINGLQAYFTMNETSSTIIDSVAGKYNTSLNVANFPNITGKLAYGRDFNYAGGADVAGTSAPLQNGNFTWSGWFLGTGNQEYIGAGDDVLLSIFGGKFGFYAKSGDCNTPCASTTAAPSGWYMLTLTYQNDTGAGKMYLNGANFYNFTETTGWDRSNAIHIGDEPAITHYALDGADEVGLWTSVLNTSQISDLYNGGSGLSFDNFQASSITLDKPVAGFNSTVPNVRFNATANAVGTTLVNMSLYTNSSGTWALDSTVSASGTSTYANFDKTFLNAGKYLWGVKACDANHNCGWSENRTINISVGSSPQFGLCGSSADLTIPIVNYTFRDSSTLASLTAYVVSSFNYSTPSNVTNSTYTYNSGSEYSSFAFCGTHYQNYTVYPNIQYASVGYPVATYLPGKVYYTNITTNTTLDLTSSATGIYVTLQTIDITLAQLSGVNINATNSTGGLLGAGTTDSAGTYTFFLEPSRLTTFNFQKTGYLLYQMSIYPTQTLYTVTMTTGTGSTNITDYGRGINYTFIPNLVYLNNNTLYNFNFTVNSTYWNVTSYGINVTINGTNFKSSFALGSGFGGMVNASVNTGTNTTFVVYGYWVINGTKTEVSRTYYIYNIQDTGWSISNFFTDLNTYLDSGLFGLQRGFDLNLIIFFIIFITTGVISWKYGLYSPLQIIFIVTILVTIFDAGLGLVANFNGSTTPIATIVAWLFLIGFYIKEVTSY